MWMPGIPGTILLLSEQMLGNASVLTNVDQTLSLSVSHWQPLYVGHCDSCQMDPDLGREVIICSDAPKLSVKIYAWYEPEPATM